MTNPCTPNAIYAIYNDQPSEAPVLQVLNSKVMPPQAGSAIRYRVLFSDGSHIMQGILGTQMNNLVESGALARYSFVKLNKYSVKILSGRKLIIGMELEVLDSFGDVGKVGEPVNIDPDQVKAVPGQGQDQGQGQGQGLRKGQQQQPFHSYQNAQLEQLQQQQEQQQLQQQQQQQQLPVSPTGGPVFPIASLSPYQNRWTIMARVTQKSDIKTWSKAGANEGKLFSMVLMDESGEIKATAFTQQVDEFYNMIEEGKVYFLSGARVDMAKKQYSNNVKNDYELILQRDTQIIPAPDNNNHVPAMRYNFVKLEALSGVNEKETVDVIAILKDVGDVSSNVSHKTHRPVIKRDLTLVDDTGYNIRLTLWGAQAESFAINGSNPVIAFKGVSVSNYNGKSLNAFGGSAFKLNPEITEAFKLRSWFDQTGQSATFQAHASEFSKTNATARKTLEEALNEVTNMDPTQPMFFDAKASIVMMTKSEHQFYYPACPTPNCNKKVTEGGNGWRCEKCNSTHPEPDYKYIMGVSVADHTGHAWIQAFNDAGQVITGRPASDLAQYPHEVKSTFDRAVFKSYIFRCRAKQETYGDETKMRFSIIAATPLNWIDESKNLLKELQAYGV